MKTNFTQVLIIRIVFFILLCLYSFLVFGQDNTLKTDTNLQSGIVPASSLDRFTGVATEEKTSLRFSLTTNNKVGTVILEKGRAKNAFQACAEFWVNFDGNKETNFQFSDKKVNKSVVYYRLKIIEADGRIQYSNILQFKSAKKKSTGSITDSASDIASLVTVNN